MAPLIQQSTDRLAALLGQHERIVLAFSGGKDSLVLLDLCRPWRERITLAWVNTGFAWPHMEAFVRSIGTGSNWEFVEIQVDLVAQWRGKGMPSPVVPTAHEPGPSGMPEREPKIQSDTACCRQNRLWPLIDHAVQAGASLLLHGQRRSDKAPMRDSMRFGALLLAAPLWEWSDVEVAKYVDERGIALPAQYAEGINSSLECWCCTAQTDPAVRNYLRRRDPEAHKQVAAAEARIRAAIMAALDGYGAEPA